MSAVYSASDPYRDYKDPCTQDLYPSHFISLRILYNQCDIINICVIETAFIQDLNNRYQNKLIVEVMIIDDFLKITTNCNLLYNDDKN